MHSFQVYTGVNATSSQQEVLDEVDNRIHAFDLDSVNFTTNWLAVITWYNVEPFGSDDVSSDFDRIRKDVKNEEFCWKMSGVIKKRTMILCV